MKHPDFDKAFAPTPEIVSLSIEAAFRKGEKAMKLRYKITATLSIAAVLAIAVGVFALANLSQPQPDVVSQPHLSETIDLTEEATVYYTPKGNYYHFIEDCSGMMGAEAHSLTEAQADGKQPCPVCASDAETYGGSITMDANGQVLQLESRPMPTEAPYDADPTPSPWVTAMPTPGPERTDDSYGPEIVEQIVYYTEKGRYYHYYLNCSGMMNARAHSITEARQAKKEPCPVCVLNTGAVSQADHMCTIGLEYFLNIFDRGLLGTFPGVDMQAFGEQTESLLWEEAHYTNDDGLYITIYREMKDDALMSGNIALTFPENFDHDAFSSGSAAWYRNVYNLAMETFVSMPMNSHINKPTDALTRIYVYFDSELKPSVCVLDFESDSGVFTLSFDVNGEQVTLASMNYGISRA